MGLLNFLTKESVGEEIGIDVEMRIRIWKKYLDSYLNKYNLAKDLLKSANLMDLLKSANLIELELVQKELVQNIEILIPRGLVDIEREEKNEREILKDLKQITSSKWSREVFDLKEVIIEEKEVKSIYKILEKLCKLLKTELHIIKIIKQNPKNIKDYLVYLYKLVITVEFNLNALFRHTLNRGEHKDTQELVHKIIRGEHIAQEIESEEERLFKEFRMIMGKESSHELRQLAHEINEELLRKVDFANDMSAEEKLHALVNNDKELIDIIRLHHPRYSERKINAIVKAFRYVFNHGNI